MRDKLPEDNGSNPATSDSVSESDSSSSLSISSACPFEYSHSQLTYLGIKYSHRRSSPRRRSPHIWHHRGPKRNAKEATKRSFAKANWRAIQICHTKLVFVTNGERRGESGRADLDECAFEATSDWTIMLQAQNRRERWG